MRISDWSSDVCSSDLLSTDKAVYPINAMGLTKALMEKVLLAQARTLAESDTILCATRYGNVMASRGSVIPLFVSQLKKKKPITVTDPNMTRFLMSLDDSVDLVLHRSEEHTSELQSLMRISYAVFCLKQKKHNAQPTQNQLQTRIT